MPVYIGKAFLKSLGHPLDTLIKCYTFIKDHRRNVWDPIDVLGSERYLEICLGRISMRQSQTKSEYRISSNNPNQPRMAVSLCRGGPVSPTDGACHSPYMSVDLAKEALFMTCQRRNPQKGMIFHSNRGSQYASTTPSNESSQNEGLSPL